MSADVLSRIEAKLDALLQMQSGHPPAPVPTADTVGPGVVTINGATIALVEPISARWKPSLTDQLLTRYGRQGVDPSDAPAGQPRRSPAGFPIVYGGPKPMLLHEGRTFETEAEIDAYEVASGRLAATNADANQKLAATVYDGRFPADSITDKEAGHIYAYTRTVAGTGLAERVYRGSGLFSGPYASISRLISRGERAWLDSKKTAFESVADWYQSDVKAAVMAVR